MSTEGALAPAPPAENWPRGEKWLLLALLLAMALRLGGLGSGLPHVYHADEGALVDLILDMLGRAELNPRWFHYPTLYIYVQALVLGIAQFLAKHLAADPLTGLGLQGLLHLCGRVTTALFGTAGVLATYLAARRLWGRAAGLGAACVLGLSFLHVQHSQYITTDVPASLFAALALWLAAAGVARGQTRWFLAGGIAAGLAAGTKYNAGLCLLTVLALWAASRTTRRDLISWAPLLTCVASAAAFLIVMPWIVLDARAVFEGGLGLQWSHYRQGHEGFEGSGNWWFYLDYLWRTGLGPGLALLVGFGWGALAGSRVRLWLALTAFPVAYYLLLASMRVRFERNLMPILPTLALFGGYGCMLCFQWLRSRPWPRHVKTAATALALAALFGWPAARIAHYDYLVMQPDTRTVAAAWMEDELPAGSTVCMERHTPPISAGVLRVARTPALCFETLGHYRDAGCDYLVVSSRMYGRYTRNASMYPYRAAWYQELFRSWDLVAEFTGHEVGEHDPVIRIYEAPR